MELKGRPTKRIVFADFNCYRFCTNNYHFNLGKIIERGDIPGTALVSIGSIALGNDG